MSTRRQFLLGIFFLTALSILGFYTLFLTDFTLFKDPIQMEVYFPDAHDLREGDPVMISGLRIGRVRSLEYLPDEEENRRILARLNLNERIELLEGARITIMESTLLGGRKVDIYAGTPGGTPLELAPDEALYGSVELNPIAALGSIGDILNENRARITNLFSNLDQITSDLRAGQGPIGRLLTDEQMAQDLSASLGSLRGLSANVQEVTEEISQGNGLLGALVMDPELADSARSAISSLGTIAEDLRAGRGLVGRLLTDEALSNEVAEAVTAFRNLGQRLEAGEGPLGLLLGDEAMGEDLRQIVSDFKLASANLERVTSQVGSGEGTIGQLVMNQELYDEALAGVKLLTRSLEDYREAAPIQAFTGVLFSSF